MGIVDDDRDHPTEVDVIIVGAGFAGLGMAIRLARSGEHSFLVLERGADVGGTWRDNTYPGVACDVPSHLYSFSFLPNARWSRVFSPGGEIQEYLRRAAEDEGILPNVRLNADMLAGTWDAVGQRWTVTTSGGVYTGRYLVLAAGHLADEKLAQIPGMDSFSGELFHSARWNHDVSLEGKRVGVVGSGASAIQIVPAVAHQVRELVVFQRSAPWVVPRMDGAYTEAEKRLFERAPETIQDLRNDIFWTFEQQYAARRKIEPFFSAIRKFATRHLHDQVPEGELRRRLTPDYDLGCKRMLISSDYYPALQQPHVTLEASPLAKIDGTTAVSAAGNSFELDVLVFATGFEAAEPPFAHHVTGKDGRSLAAHWAAGMHALNSTAVPGFPNMFVLNGPNTGVGHTSTLFLIETQVEFVLSAMAHARAGDIGTVEATSVAEAGYQQEVRDRSAGTVWVDGGCKNWYVDPRSGDLTVIWPDFAYVFRDRNGSFDPDGYELVRGEVSA
ncbi:MAG: NAD(P)/FAD-dependent oxidoreductase [Pseudonocardia sp.]|uniref:flavin-containing monooxygenase n=1 Tax=unclassified Pseudonocardia TaxID=2619320 RepID=UPI00086D8C2A|nr:MULTISPECIES: NAD(P)/FAD-dependent oxidoreductase [unclassified Pseudonocardia]MBN9112431.1 NAD(P)/FAD-dependent oxidoreductase [Pseudonocardia sp.]ODU27297.1 MAG: 4-hydroxyacetophenone monooxygenase [Pseudonocardia sp. SCN 72-51]ODV08910.1 MAG: 4-hydroxyacetophenone monooxygenase [Pseudonocardia sp. SCN 73-27]